MATADPPHEPADAPPQGRVGPAPASSPQAYMALVDAALAGADTFVWEWDNAGAGAGGGQRYRRRHGPG